MSSIHSNLVFDHLYISLNDEEFEEIKKIFLQFECASHQNVKSDDDSWEGVYVRTRGRSYLEFLKNRRSSGIGLCQRAFGFLNQDARHIVHDFPNLPWQTFERSIQGKKWFTALACDNYLDLTTPFNTWVMHYHQFDGGKIVNIPKQEISKVTEVHCSAHPDLIDKVKLNSAWFNGKAEITSDEARFELQTYYSDPFLLNISFDNSRPGFKFKKAMLTMEPGFKADTTNLKNFKFFEDDGIHTLERN